METSHSSLFQLLAPFPSLLSSKIRAQRASDSINRFVTGKKITFLYLPQNSIENVSAFYLPSAVATSATESDQVRMRTGGERNSCALAELKRRFQFISGEAKSQTKCIQYPIIANKGRRCAQEGKLCAFSQRNPLNATTNNDEKKRKLGRKRTRPATNEAD